MRAADLKILLRIWEGLRNDRPGGYCEYRQDLVCSDNGVSAMGYILSHSQSLQRRLSSQNIPVFRAIACDGICLDDISRKSQRYRSVSDIPNSEAISHGDIKCRLSYVGVALYLSRFDSSYIKPYIFRNGAYGRPETSCLA